MAARAWGRAGRAYTAARGVGAIMGSNPLPVVVPCHRVLGSDSLGGFGGGRATKEWLLALEGVLTPALDFGFSDTGDSPANNLLAVRINTLPGVGTLTNSGVAVTLGQSISLADLSAGRIAGAAVLLV